MGPCLLEDLKNGSMERFSAFIAMCVCVFGCVGVLE